MEDKYDGSKEARAKRALEADIKRRMNYLRTCSDSILRHIVIDYINKENI